MQSAESEESFRFRAPRFTLFHIDPTRSTSVLQRLLGSEFSGTLGSDYYSAYRCYLKLHPQADAQFCLAHLVRLTWVAWESLRATSPSSTPTITVSPT